MAISMTRVEYEAKYGTPPIFGATQSKIDTTPSPTAMTSAEYKIRYGVDPITGKPIDNSGIVSKLFTPAKESIQGLKELYGGGENGIANKLSQDIQAGASDIQKGMETGGIAGVPSVLKGMAKSGLRTAGDVATTIFAPISAIIGTTGIGKATDYAGKWLIDNYGQSLTENPTFQKYAIEHPNAGEDFNRALMLTMAAFDPSKIEPSTIIERTKIQAKDFANEIKSKLPQIRDSVDKTIDEIANIENNYAKTRKANDYAKDTVVSRERIAKSGVLDNSVNENGLIQTKQKGGAVEQYRKLTLDGAEDVVRKGLEQEGKIVNLAEVSKDLTDKIMKSTLEGADLKAALTGVTREIQGLMKRADADGNIPLYKIHEAKINTTKNINYNTPPETATFRKALASGYKTIVEKTSLLPIENVNAELGKYLSDIERLENLDGLRVKGGKLGKYTAQITGNLAGGAVGGLTGGMGGMALGTIVGGEVAALLKGKSLAGTFGKITTPEVPRSPILEEAKAGFPNTLRVSPLPKSDIQPELGIKKSSQTLPNSTTETSLMQEAMKYESADEFIKSQLDKILKESNWKNTPTKIMKIDEIYSKINKKIPPSTYTSPKNLSAIEQSIKNNGVKEPIQIIERNNIFDIFDGNNRLETAKKLGLKEIPVKIIKELTDSQLNNIWNKAKHYNN